MTIANFGYAVMQMNDPAAWQNFGVDILGMEAVDAPGGGEEPYFHDLVKGG